MVRLDSEPADDRAGTPGDASADEGEIPTKRQIEPMDAVIIPANWREVRRPRPSISMCRDDFTSISAPPQCNHAPEHKCRRSCSFFRVATDPSWHLVKVEEPGAGESRQPAPGDQPVTR